MDAQGNLLTATGQKVQGWTSMSGQVNTNQAIGDISVPLGALKSPQATKNFSLDLNLDASGATGDTFSAPVQIYDSLGASHILTVTFTKDATSGQWDYTVTIPGADVGDTTDATKQLATGSVNFDSTGTLTTPASTDPPISFDVTGFADGAADITGLNWNVYNGTTPELTQYDQASATSASTQDGSAAAQLNSVSLANGGEVVAQYSDGQQLTVGQVALASIPNPDSLVAVGNNNFQLSAETAVPTVGVPGTGGRGQVLGGSIESSNVDIATEFTNLIVYQNAYQANAKVITTADQLSQDTISLKQ